MCVGDLGRRTVGRVDCGGILSPMAGMKMSTGLLVNDECTWDFYTRGDCHIFIVARGITSSRQSKVEKLEMCTVFISDRKGAYTHM